MSRANRARLEVLEDLSRISLENGRLAARVDALQRLILENTCNRSRTLEKTVREIVGHAKKLGGAVAKPVLRSVLELEEGVERMSKVDSARLYVIVDLEVTKRSPVRLAESIARAGADIIQLRTSRLSDRKLLQVARDMVRRVKRVSRSLVIINNRVDIALESRADGVHLGENDLDIESARSILGPFRVIGATTHNATEARRAKRAGADYLSYGPVFPTGTKPGLTARGFAYLDAIKRLKRPFFAIGGIDSASLKKLKRKGVGRVCVCAAVLKASDPVRETRKLRRALTR